MKKSRTNPILAILSRALGASALLAGLNTAAWAGTIYWDGIVAANPGSPWNDAANWSMVANADTPDPVAAPIATDDVIFNIAAATAASGIHLNADQAAQSLTFSSPGGVTVFGNSANSDARNFALGAGGVTMNSGAGPVLLSGSSGTNGTINFQINDSQTWKNHSASQLGLFGNNATATTIAADKVLTFDGSGPIQVGSTTSALGNITGAGGITKSGSGTLTMFSNSTYSGGTILNSGTIAIGNAGALGTGGALTINGGTIRADTTSARSLAGKLTGITVNSDVTLGDTVATGGLTFDAPINLGSATRTLTVNSSVTLGNAAAGVIGGAPGVGLVKNGSGSLTLSGTTAHTFDGGITVNGGTVNLTFSNMTTPGNLLPSGSTVAFANASTLNVNGKPSVATTQGLGNLTIGGGRNLLTAAAGASSTIVLTLGNTWTRNDRGALHTLLNTSTGVTLTSNPALANGIVGPWATIYQSAAPAGTYYATVSGGSLVPLTSGANFSSVAQSSGLTDTTGTINYDLVDVGPPPNDTAPAGFVGNTVRYIKAASGTTQLGGSFSTNGLMNSANTNSVVWTLGAGTLTIGSNKELVVNTFTRTGPSGNGMTINANIVDNAAGASGLTVISQTSTTSTHPTQISLLSANEYTGKTTINGSGGTSDGQRTIIITALRNTGTKSEFGTGSELALNTAVVQTNANGTGTCDRSIAITGDSGFYLKGAYAQTLSGTISGSGNLFTDGDFVSNTTPGGSGNLILAGDNSFTGEMRFQTDSRVTLGHVNALKNATLVMAGQRILADLTTNNLAYNIGGLRGNVNLNLGSGGGAGGLVSIGDNNQSNTYIGAISGSAGLTKTGTGTQTLLAANTFTGSTVIENGTLKLGATAVSAMTGTGASGAVTITALSSTAGLSVGQSVSGTGIAAGAKIASIDSTTQVTVSAAHTGALSGTLTFGYLSASLASPVIDIKAGTALDLSAQPAYALGAGTTLKATGTATAAATLAGSAAGTVDFGTRPVQLTYTPDTFSGDSNSQALQIASGALTLNGAITVTNNSGTPLGEGTYTLIKQASGTISGTPTLAGGTVGGSGVAAGKNALLLVSGNEVQLVVLTLTGTTTTLARHSGTGATTTYGGTIQFDVTLDQPAATGTVELRDGGPTGILIGSGPITAGNVTISTLPNALAAGTHDNIVAIYLGDYSTYAGSTSSALAPAQEIAQKPLTITGTVVADSKYYDGTPAATLSGGTLAGVVTGDEALVTLIQAGAFDSSGPGTGIAVTPACTLSGASAGNYTLTQPTVSTADIYAEAIWTGEAETEVPWLWGTPVNWDLELVPSAGGVTANFSTINLVGDETVSLGTTPRTIGHMVFGEADTDTIFGGWTVAGSTLTLAGVTKPSVTVNDTLGTGKTVTVSSILAGANGFTKSGPGTLVVSGVNTYSGQTVISAGTLRLGAAGGVPTGSMIVLGDANSGTATTTLQFINGTSSPIQLGTAPSSFAVLDNTPGTTVTNSITNPINLNGRSLRFANSGSQLYNVNGKISGTGDVNIDTPSYAYRMRLNSSLGSDFVGNVNILSGGMQVTDSGTTDKNVIPDTADVNMSASTIMGIGADEKFGALNGNASAIVGENHSTAGISLKMTLGTNNHDGAFDGTIPLGDVGNALARPNMPLAIVKVGTGTQVFNGVCASTAATTINGGKLEINAAYASPVTVAVPVAPATSATLGGIGNLTATTSVTATVAGSKVAPGKPTGTLKAASANLSGSGTLEIHINDAATDKCGVLEVTGDLNITGATLNVTGTAAEKSYVIARFGTLTGTSFATVNKPSSYNVVYDTTAKEIRLVKVAGYDAWEQAKITDPDKRGRSADPDGDGFTNFQEFLFGKDPVANDGALSTQERVGNDLVIHWNERTPGVTYKLMESATLAAGSWTQNTTGTLANDGAVFGDDISGHYQPRKATVPIGSGTDFFRVEGTETP